MNRPAFPTPTDADWAQEAELLCEQHKLRFGQTPAARTAAMEAIERLKAARSPEMLAYLGQHPEAA